MDNTQVPATPAQQQTTATKPEATNQNGTGLVTSAIVPKATPTTMSVTAPEDKIVWRSDDGLIVIKQLVRQAQRHPPSDYPCVVIQAFPAQHERVRRIPEGGVELMPAHVEFDAMVDAINDVSISQGKGKLYEVLQRVPPKSKERKDAWKQFHANRTSSKRWRSSRRWPWRRNR